MGSRSKSGKARYRSSLWIVRVEPGEPCDETLPQEYITLIHGVSQSDAINNAILYLEISGWPSLRWRSNDFILEEKEPSAEIRSNWTVYAERAKIGSNIMEELS